MSVPIEELGTFSDVLFYLERQGIAKEDASEIVTLVFMWGIHAAMDRYHRVTAPADVLPRAELFSLIDSGPPPPVKVKRPKTARPPREKSEETEWPEGFVLTSDMRTYATSQGVDPDRLWRRFESVNRSTGRKYKRWNMAWRTWVDTEADKQRPAQSSSYIDGRL